MQFPGLLSKQYLKISPLFQAYALGYSLPSLGAYKINTRLLSAVAATNVVNGPTGNDGIRAQVEACLKEEVKQIQTPSLSLLKAGVVVLGKGSQIMENEFMNKYQQKYRGTGDEEIVEILWKWRCTQSKNKTSGQSCRQLIRYFSRSKKQDIDHLDIMLIHYFFHCQPIHVGCVFELTNVRLDWHHPSMHFVGKWILSALLSNSPSLFPNKGVSSIDEKIGDNIGIVKDVCHNLQHFFLQFRLLMSHVFDSSTSKQTDNKTDRTNKTASSIDRIDKTASSTDRMNKTIPLVALLQEQEQTEQLLKDYKIIYLNWLSIRTLFRSTSRAFVNNLALLLQHLDSVQTHDLHALVCCLQITHYLQQQLLRLDSRVILDIQIPIQGTTLMQQLRKQVNAYERLLSSYLTSKGSGQMLNPKGKVQIKDTGQMLRLSALLYCLRVVEPWSTCMQMHPTVVKTVLWAMDEVIQSTPIVAMQAQVMQALVELYDGYLLQSGEQGGPLQRKQLNNISHNIAKIREKSDNMNKGTIKPISPAFKMGDKGTIRNANHCRQIWECLMSSQPNKALGLDPAQLEIVRQETYLLNPTPNQDEDKDKDRDGDQHKDRDGDQHKDRDRDQHKERDGDQHKERDGDGETTPLLKQKGNKVESAVKRYFTIQ